MEESANFLFPYYLSLFYNLDYKDFLKAIAYYKKLENENDEDDTRKFLFFSSFVEEKLEKNPVPCVAAEICLTRCGLNCCSHPCSWAQPRCVNCLFTCLISHFMLIAPNNNNKNFECTLKSGGVHCDGRIARQVWECYIQQVDLNH